MYNVESNSIKGINAWLVGTYLDDEASSYLRTSPRGTKNTELYCTYKSIATDKVRWSKKRKLHSTHKIGSRRCGRGKVKSHRIVALARLLTCWKSNILYSSASLCGMGIHGDRLGEKAAASSHRWLSVSVSHEMRPPDGGRRHNGNPSLQEVFPMREGGRSFHGTESPDRKKKKRNWLQAVGGGQRKVYRIHVDCDFEKI